MRMYAHEQPKMRLYLNIILVAQSCYVQGRSFVNELRSSNGVYGFASETEKLLKGTLMTFSPEALDRGPPGAIIPANTGMHRAKTWECTGSSEPSSSLRRTPQLSSRSTDPSAR